MRDSRPETVKKMPNMPDMWNIRQANSAAVGNCKTLYSDNGAQFCSKGSTASGRIEGQSPNGH